MRCSIAVFEMLRRRKPSFLGMPWWRSLWPGVFERRAFCMDVPDLQVAADVLAFRTHKDLRS